MTEMTSPSKGFFERTTARKRRPAALPPDPDAEPTAQVIYDDLMKKSYAPALRAAGLKGSGGRFELPSEEYGS